jgi:hypothetical protein
MTGNGIKLPAVKKVMPLLIMEADAGRWFSGNRSGK